MGTDYLPATIGAAQVQAKNARQLPIHPESKKPLGYWDPRTLTQEYEEQGPTLVPIKWDYGYPVIASNDLPLWDRLDGEPNNSFQLFQRFLTQVAPRNVITLADQAGENRMDVGNLASLYIWHLRANAYDTYLSLQRENAAAAAVEEVETKHKTFARKLLQKVEDALDNMEIEEIGPQQIKDLVQIAVQMERISVKLPANAPAAQALTRTYEKEKIEHEAAAKAKEKPSKTINKTEVHTEQANIQINYTDDWRSS